MSSLVPTLARHLEQADALFADGRVPQARRAYEDLVQRAQDRVDRPTETVARAMLARCLLRLREPDGAREQLDRVATLTDPGNAEAHGRYRAARARLAVEDGPADQARTELLAYLRWAEEAGRGPEGLDACALLAVGAPAAQRADWL